MHNNHKIRINRYRSYRYQDITENGVYVLTIFNVIEKHFDFF